MIKLISISIQGSYSFQILEFHHFPWPLQIFGDLQLRSCFQNFVKTIYIYIFFLSSRFIIPTPYTALVILYYKHNFLWLTITPTQVSWLSRPEKLNFSIPWLSRFFQNRTNPAIVFCISDTVKYSKNNQTFINILNLAWPAIGLLCCFYTHTHTHFPWANLPKRVKVQWG